MRTAELSTASRRLAAPATLKVLLRELVDYAGLFPPAELPMADAVKNYAVYRTSPQAWALGRFVTPVARFAEFASAYTSLPKQAGVWRISALLGKDVAADLASVDAFNRSHHGQAVVDVVEVKTSTAEEIACVAKLLPAGIDAYCEVSPLAASPLLSVIRDAGMRAKIRTGGLTQEAFPAAKDIAEFLCSCAVENVAFKATAGLHHPLRCERPLTYEPDSTTGTMHGFLNLFLAASLARRGSPPDQVCEILLASSADEFQFSPGAVTWRDISISLEEISRTREDFAISFGSCSFEEPISDLEELRLL